MTESSSKKASTRVSRVLKADRKAVYRAFLDPDSLASWLAPNNMKGQVHAFDAREGGTFRMSLTYLDPEHSLSGKLPHTQTRSKVVIEFESQDPAFRGEMRMTVSLADAASGTEVTIELVCKESPEAGRTHRMMHGPP
jgi:uncharacterized protein YndB with AHSA1/START domain